MQWNHPGTRLQFYSPAAEWKHGSLIQVSAQHSLEHPYCLWRQRSAARSTPGPHGPAGAWPSRLSVVVPGRLTYNRVNAAAAGRRLRTGGSSGARRRARGEPSPAAGCFSPWLPAGPARRPPPPGASSAPHRPARPSRGRGRRRARGASGPPAARGPPRRSSPPKGVWIPRLPQRHFRPHCPPREAGATASPGG